MSDHWSAQCNPRLPQQYRRCTSAAVGPHRHNNSSCLVGVVASDTHQRLTALSHAQTGTLIQPYADQRSHPLTQAPSPPTIRTDVSVLATSPMICICCVPPSPTSSDTQVAAHCSTRPISPETQTQAGAHAHYKNMRCTTTCTTHPVLPCCLVTKRTSRELSHAQASYFT